MKNVLLEAYMTKNLGDDLFLKVLFDRYPDVKWILNTKDKEYLNMFKEYKNIKLKENIFIKVLKKVKLIKNYDGVVFIGGSVFMQNGDWQGLYSARNKIVDMLNGKPVYFLGANFGPFYTNEFKENYGELFKKCEDICFRDKYSYDLFKDLANVRIAPDIIFGLKAKMIEKINNSLGISVISLKGRSELEQHQDSYNQKMKELIEKAIDCGKSVTLFSFCEDEKDLQAINDIVNLIDDKYREHITIENYTGNLNEFLTKFEQMENIVGARFHACILSQVFNQGLYPIIYSDKTYNVLHDINLDKEYTYINKINELDVDNLLKVISNNKVSDRTIFEDSQNHFLQLDKFLIEKNV